MILVCNIDQLNLSLEPGYLWLKVRRKRFARAITGSINGCERTGGSSGSSMLLPIEGQKVEGIGPSLREKNKQPQVLNVSPVVKKN